MTITNATQPANWDDHHEDEARAIRARRATHLHVKSGNLYTVLARGLNEKTLIPGVCYESVNDGRVWWREALEFDDGRFAPLGKV